MKKKRSYRIRLAHRRDLDALYDLELAAFTSDRFTKDAISYLLSESRATTLVAYQDNKILGAACLLWRKAHLGARLYNMAVHPESQGLGIGLALIRECELEAARRGCSKITLEVRQDNDNGIRFYERQGFVTVGSMADYYEDGTTGLKMSKPISVVVPDKVRLDVPYYSQTLDFTCGPASLMMTLKYFDPKLELTRGLELTLWKEATTLFMASGYGGTDGYGLALSALHRGLTCRLVSSMDRTPMLKSVRSQGKRDVMRILHHDMKRQARAAGLSSSIYKYDIDEIISALHRNMIAIVMISTYRLTGDRMAHWVVVTGCDKNHIYIHDPDIASYRRNRSRARNLKIEKDEFMRLSSYGKEQYRCLLTIGGAE